VPRGPRSQALLEDHRFFERYDVDRDGKISKQEQKKLLEDIDIGNTFTRGAWVHGILEKVDTNHDKSISWDEFRVVAGLQADDSPSGAGEGTE
jgi:Ca2+-binding EF-hand superfamily protein